MLTKAKGFSLHVGVNSVDPSHYDGWSGPLAACELDALDMAEIMHLQGFQTTTMLTKSAKANAVLAAIRYAASAMKPGDIFVFTNSSHGSQVPDPTWKEADGMNETLCMYDREIIDDEFAALWNLFPAGSRVIMISDSCHSGTVAREIGCDSEVAEGSRLVPVATAMATYQKNAEVYDNLPRGELPPPKASVLLISGCQDNQTSLDGMRNGKFTGTLRRVLNHKPASMFSKASLGGYKGSYSSLHAQIRRLMPLTQSPNLDCFGPDHVNLARSVAFSI